MALLGVIVLVGCGGAYETGDYYSVNGVKGVVVTATDNALLVVSLDEARGLNADSALAWGDGPEEWHLPSKTEIEQLWRFRSAINQTLERKGMGRIFGSHTFYWSSTECSPSHVYACGPDGVKCYFRSNKSHLYRARKVVLVPAKQ